MSGRRAGSAASGRLLRVLLVMLVLAAMAGTASAGYALTDRARRPHPPAALAVPAVPAALGQATTVPSRSRQPTPDPTATAGRPTASGITTQLGAALSASALGHRLVASVVDATTGQPVFSQSAGTAVAPASTAKLMTAAAVLATHSAQDRITTTVYQGSVPGSIVVVGGGDPTLSGAAAGRPTLYPDAARLSDLAGQLQARGITVRSIVVDDDLFYGPDVSPYWANEDVPSSYASAITAFMADGGRATPAATIRSDQPDFDAAKELATMLGNPNMDISRGSLTPGSPKLASVQSPPLLELITQMLQDSDNVIAECLARQVALAKNVAPTFVDSASAVRAVLTSIGVDPGGGLTDGSGLAASDRLSPGALTKLLDLVVDDPAQPELSALASALPVADWSGTLSARFVGGSASAAGAGVVRAKTGTLTGVSTLAGIVRAQDGRVLVFAFMADQVGPSTADTDAAESALDVLAARLVGCGCDS